MNYMRLSKIALIMIYLSMIFIPVSAAQDSVYDKIRQASSRRSQALFNDIAIDLLNGKTRQIPVNKMMKLLKNLEVIEFSSSDLNPVREIIMREVAFRMLNNHYIPRIGDKITVHRGYKAFDSDSGFSLRLPFDEITVKNKDRLKTLFWGDLVAQISLVIDRLWLSRIETENIELTLQKIPKKSLIRAITYIDSKYSSNKKAVGSNINQDIAALAIFNATEDSIEFWLGNSLILNEDLPTFIKLIKQFICLSVNSDYKTISKELRNIKSISALKSALINKVSDTVVELKSTSSTDYAAFAMLQSLLNDISRDILFLSGRFGAPKNSQRLDIVNSYHWA